MGLFLQDSKSKTGVCVVSPVFCDSFTYFVLNECVFHLISMHDWQVAMKRVDAGRRLVETLQSFMRERAQLEEVYAAGLERLSKRLSAPVSESRFVVYPEVIVTFGLLWCQLFKAI